MSFFGVPTATGRLRTGGVDFSAAFRYAFLNLMQRGALYAGPHFYLYQRAR